MKTLTKELWMNVPERRAIVSIHRDVERLVAESKVKEGLALINAMHITASVFINDNEPGLHRDYDKWLEETRRPITTTTTAPAKTTPTPTTSDKSWAEKSSLPSPTENYISALGSTSSITSSMAVARNGYL
jgi:hypothetical protein